MSERYVWVFNGEGASFPSGVFSNGEVAEHWIASNSLSGTLTAYPLDKALFDWVTENRSFRPKKPVTPDLIAGFSSAYQEHYHYHGGVHK